MIGLIIENWLTLLFCFGVVGAILYLLNQKFGISQKLSDFFRRWDEKDQERARDNARKADQNRQAQEAERALRQQAEEELERELSRYRSTEATDDTATSHDLRRN